MAITYESATTKSVAVFNRIVPAEVVEGDLILWFMLYTGYASPRITALPSGWNFLSNVYCPIANASTYDNVFATAYKVSDGTEAGVTTGEPTVSGAGNKSAYVVHLSNDNQKWDLSAVGATDQTGTNISTKTISGNLNGGINAAAGDFFIYAMGWQDYSLTPSGNGTLTCSGVTFGTPTQIGTYTQYSGGSHQSHGGNLVYNTVSSGSADGSPSISYQQGLSSSNTFYTVGSIVRIRQLEFVGWGLDMMVS